MYQIFVPFSTIIQGQLNAGVQHAVAAGLNAIAAPLATTLTIFVIIQGVGIMGTPWGRYDFWTGFRNMMIAGIVAALLTTGYFQQFIETPFLTTIPNWIASSINGATGTQAGAQQFDLIWSACAHLQAAILQASSPIYDLDVRIEAGLYIGLVAIALGISYIIWTLAGFFMALTVCAGPFVLAGMLFERTRHYATGWLDIMVGQLILQLMIVILLAIFVGRISQYMRQAASNPATSVDEQVNALLEIALFIFMCSIVTVGVPFLAARISGGVSVPISSIIRA